MSFSSPLVHTPQGALAAELAEGKPKGGYCWQKVIGSNGMKMLCHFCIDGQVQKAATCTSAGLRNRNAPPCSCCWPALPALPRIYSQVLATPCGRWQQAGNDPHGLHRRPERAHRPYGAAFRQRIQELALVGSLVSLRPQTIDMYGRTVAEVFSNGQNINLAVVSSGQAFAYRK